jgi:hypothetical protein
MQTKKLIWAQIAYKSNKLPHNYSQTKNPQIPLLHTHFEQLIWAHIAYKSNKLPH